MSLKISRKYVPLTATFVVFVVLFGIASLRYEGFASAAVVVELFSENAFLGICALGMTLVILSGGIDLSVGSVVGFTSTFVATMIMEYAWHPINAWAVALVLGTVFGAGMGCLIHFYKLPAFLVTLGGLFFARGMAYAVNRESLGINHDLYNGLASANIPLGGGLSLSLTASLFIAFFVLTFYIGRYTKFGRNVYAIGGDEDSALLMGLPVGRTKIGVYAFSGFCSAAAGIVMTLYTWSGNPLNGVALELDAIAVVVVGGTLLTGGVGFVAGTLLGVLIYGTIQQAIYFDGNLSSSLTSVAIGVLLLIFILLQKAIVSKGEEA
ncbi:sugar ABC transporter permease YjfF [Pelagicoccus mobilis]|uniref:Sugar ABC transporter permease YjfF n=1 Tax=Pelagicoccus mobilis TaxID=415221 RepID=A0A934S0I7_9BACT|nr:galactofuranose ABC transporter, permease protein YjfF [Pelagicoccus mobilis]MBK1878955.1 sugar ABC transporter permease YjfF [Pelagicoccus mobilis]